EANATLPRLGFLTAICGQLIPSEECEHRAAQLERCEILIAELLPTHVCTPGGKAYELRSDELREELSSRYGSAVELMNLKHGIFDWISAPVATSQRRAVASSLPVSASLPSGENATPQTRAVCPRSSRISFPVAASQRRAVPS